MSENNIMPSCCKPNIDGQKKKGCLQGIIFGLLPHTFCILFIGLTLIGSIAGATVMQKFLFIPYFFPLLALMSIALASLSAFIYLKKFRALSLTGIKMFWKYLTVLFSLTVLVNLIFIYFIFPAVIASTSKEEKNISAGQEEATLKVRVQIPCSGHAPLIISEVKKAGGVLAVKYLPQSDFIISYDLNKITEADILSLEVFKNFPATKI